MSKREEYGRLAHVFLLLGLLGFGGPSAHLAMMENECVQRRRWLTREELLDLIGAANLLPGPNSTQVAFGIGLRRAGYIGMLVAGCSFVLPAAMLSGILARAYVVYGSLPAIASVLLGTKAAMIGIMLGTAIRLAPTATKSPSLVAIGILAIAAAVLFGVPPVAVLLGAGALGSLGARAARAAAVLPFIVTVRSYAFGAAAAGLGAIGVVGLLGIFGYFLYVGATVYGGGFVLVSYLHDGLVRDLHWLNDKQLLDAIAVGQITPGPVFSTSTFIGYLLGGPIGAVAATVGIFLPCLIFVPVMHKFVGWAHKNPRAQGFLDGVSIAAIGLIFAIGLGLGPSAAGTPILAAGAAGAGLLTVLRINPGFVVLVAGILGWAVHFI